MSHDLITNLEVKHPFEKSNGEILPDRMFSLTSWFVPFVEILSVMVVEAALHSNQCFSFVILHSSGVDWGN